MDLLTTITVSTLEAKTNTELQIRNSNINFSLIFFNNLVSLIPHNGRALGEARPIGSLLPNGQLSEVTLLIAITQFLL